MGQKIQITVDAENFVNLRTLLKLSTPSTIDSLVEDTIRRCIRDNSIRNNPGINFTIHLNIEINYS